MYHRDRRLSFRNPLALATVAFAVSALAFVPTAAVAESPSGNPRVDGSSTNDEVTSGDAARGGADAATGMRIYIDPTTGRIAEPPRGAEGAASGVPASPRGVGASAAGLAEVPSPVDGGGVMVDLQGRFRSVMKATRTTAGGVTTDCAVTGAAPSGREEP